MKIREVLKIIEKDGWLLNTAKGSHRQYKHPAKKGLVTVAGHRNDDLHPKTKSSILKPAGLK